MTSVQQREDWCRGRWSNTLHKQKRETICLSKTCWHDYKHVSPSYKLMQSSRYRGFKLSRPNACTTVSIVRVKDYQLWSVSLPNAVIIQIPKCTCAIRDLQQLQSLHCHNIPSKNFHTGLLPRPSLTLSPHPGGTGDETRLYLLRRVTPFLLVWWQSMLYQSASLHRMWSPCEEHSVCQRKEECFVVALVLNYA